MLNVIFPNRSLPYKIFKILLLLLLFFSVAYNSWADKAATMESMHPGLAGGFLKSALLEPMDNKILLKADGITISQSEINNAIADHDPEMRGQLEKNLVFVLEQETVRRILLNEAQKNGIEMTEDDSQVIQALFEQKTRDAAVSEDEARVFYEANKQMVGGAPFEQVAEGIRHYMLQDKKQQAVEEYIDGLGDSVVLHINEKWVNEQSRLALDNPVDKARRSGKPTLVEFGATGCVPCDMMQPILDKLRKDYPENLNVVFIHVGEEQILASRFGIRSIPVQAFFNARGEEVFRHVGFLAEKDVIKQLEKMGIQK
jgi:thiol-disulfide isomerase/thioredoxin